MTLLGFDPTRLARLRRSMRLASDALWTIRSTDPFAAQAVSYARRFRDELETSWLPLVDRALQLDDDGPDAATLELIAADPDAARSFAAQLDWAALCNRLAERRLLADAGVTTWPPATVAQIDEVMSALAHVQRVVLSGTSACPSPDAVVPQLAQMTPYAAALLVRELDLDAFTLATVTADLLHQWLLSEPSASGAPLPEWSLPGANPADLLFTLLAADPHAASVFVLRAAEEPAILFETAADEHLAATVAVVGTDPGVLAVDDAELVLTGLIEYGSSYGLAHRPSNDTFQPDMAVVLADLVVPWTMQFSPLDASWKASAERRAALLALALDDARAVDRLVAQADQVTAAVTSDPARPGATATLEVFTAYLSMLTDLVVRERVEDEEHARARWDFLWQIAGIPVKAAAPTPAAKTGVTVAMAGGRALAEQWAPDPERVLADAEFARTYTLTVAAARVAATVHTRWIADGLVPRSLPPPPAPRPASTQPVVDFLVEFRRWRGALPGGDEGPLAREITALVYTIVNPEEAGADATR